VTVVDARGNACSLINSLFQAFGSGIACPETGVVFHNRGAGFRTIAGHPNAAAPLKRPLHTIIPGFAMKNGRPWLSFGVMGGAYQPVGQVHVLQTLIDYGLDVQEALDAPRGFRGPDTLEAERMIEDRVLIELAERGHPIKRADVPPGGAQAILIEPASGILCAGSDPRKDGCALAM
jgi:gamma-glutamyltranspeptidase/glutathione hydrolase